MRLRFTKSTPVYIYGAGEVGKKCADDLTSSGYTIVSIIDREKEGNTVCPPYQVIKLINVKNSGIDSDHSVVIICLSDGMQHRTVADTLSKLGFRYIVFLPIEFGLPCKVLDKYIAQYNDLISGSFDCCEEITEYDDLFDLQFPHEDSFKVINGTDLIISVPLEMLFSEDFLNTTKDKSKFIGKYDIYDVPMEGYEWYLDLWRYLDCNSVDTGVFFESFKLDLTAEKRQKELKDREALFRLYDRQLSNGLSFFEYSAPGAEYNESKKCFNLTGGHHRVTYLVYRGFRMIPCKMSVSDFKKWYNKTAERSLAVYLHRTRLRDINIQIPHPAFLNYPYKRNAFGDCSMKAVLLYLKKKGITDFSRFKVLDASNMDGLYARNAFRMNAFDIKRVARNVEYEELLTNLLRLNYEVVDANLTDLKGNYDIVFADDYLCRDSKTHTINTDAEELIMTKLSDITSEYLFYESQSGRDSGLDPKEFGFKLEEEFKSELVDGTVRSMKVYSRHKEG